MEANFTPPHSFCRQKSKAKLATFALPGTDVLSVPTSDFAEPHKEAPRKSLPDCPVQLEGKYWPELIPPIVRLANWFACKEQVVRREAGG